MEPRRVKRDGRELGNAAAAALICVDPRTGKPIKPSTYQWYVAQGKPAGNRAPDYVEVDNDTGQRMYDLHVVREWHRNRPGRGNWGGDGAKARRGGGETVCNYCARTVGVTSTGRMQAHDEHEGRDALQCQGSGELAPARPDVVTKGMADDQLTAWGLPHVDVDTAQGV